MALAIYIMPSSSCRHDTRHLCHIVVVVVVVVVIVVAATAPVSRHWSSIFHHGADQAHYLVIIAFSRFSARSEKVLDSFDHGWR